MYRRDVIYKFELKKGIFYTGRILEEDDINIRIITTRNENMVLSKVEISQAWEVPQ